MRVRGMLAGLAALGMVVAASSCSSAGSTSSAAAASTSSTAAAAGGTDGVLTRAYATDSPSQVLDLARPDDVAGAVPVVVVVHGGAFAGGSRADVGHLVRALTDRGYAAAALDYRLSGEAPFPAAVQDVTAAIRWLRADAAGLGIDPDRIGAWGLSAGGHLVAMAAVTADRGTLLAPEAPGAGPSGALQAVVSWYGPMDFGTMDAQAVDPGGCPGEPVRHSPADSAESRFLGGAIPDVPDLVRAAAPASYLDGGAAGEVPPFYLAHGDRDCIVPFAQTVEFGRALAAAGAPVTVDIVAGAGHAVPEFDRAQLEPSLAFFDEALGSGR